MERQTLVPLDGSPLAEAALPHAVQLAHAYASTLHLLYTIESAAVSHTLVWTRPGPVQSHGWLAAEQQAAADYLADLAQQLRLSGLGVHVSIRTGHPTDTILRLLDEHPNIRDVVLATHEQSGRQRWLGGGGIEKLLLNAAVPILVVQVPAAHEPLALQRPLPTMPPYTSVLVPLDGSVFAEQALAEAQSLVYDWQATLVLLAVLPSLGEPWGRENRALFHWSESEPQLAQRSAIRYLESTAQRLRLAGLTVRTQWVSGTPDAMIATLAEQEHVDLIVMATHRRSGLSRFWFSGVAMHVIRHTPTPILLIRPPLQREHGAAFAYEPQ